MGAPNRWDIDFGSSQPVGHRFSQRVDGVVNNNVVKKSERSDASIHRVLKHDASVRRVREQCARIDVSWRCLHRVYLLNPNLSSSPRVVAGAAASTASRRRTRRRRRRARARRVDIFLPHRLSRARVVRRATGSRTTRDGRDANDGARMYGDDDGARAGARWWTRGRTGADAWEAGRAMRRARERAAGGDGAW